ncbi:MAG: radical SAM protein [Candidatus Omnitrophica bacterium]|nr:radical SAM protein [Candidatus Omnitrophota bacterium]MDD5553262.1 radical SAM protein [Candidatus Omnitrophota bacterium]
MKVTFLIPPVLDGTKNVDRCFGCNYSIYFLPLLPVLYAATVLKRTGDEVSILDFPGQKKTEEELRDFIRKDNSDIYAFYTVFLCQNTDLLARKMIRETRPGVKFIFCGPQPTFAPEVFLDKEDSFCARGEPEFIIKELITALKTGSGVDKIRGISHYSSGITHNPAADVIADLDSVPIPDRSILDHKPYFNPKLRSMPHTACLTSRGCFGRCWYCVPNSLSYARELEHKKEFHKKPAPRMHSARRVIEEFSDIARRGFRSVSVIDDEFLWDDKRTLEICRGIAPLGLEWSCLCRPEKINEEVASAMKSAGCAYVDMGTESFDEKVLAAIKKDISGEDTKRAVRILKKYKIEIELNVLLGATPMETEGTIRKTLAEVRRLNVDYALFSIANPFPGTDFYYAAKKEGWMFYGDYVPKDPAKNAIISYPHLSKEKLEKLLSYAYLSYYLNPRYLCKQLFKVRSLKDLTNKLSTAFNFFRKNFFEK